MEDAPYFQTDLEGWTILFDLDGTLVETAPDLLAALNHTLDAYDVPTVALPQIRTMIGHGAKAMIREGFALSDRTISEALLAEAWPRFIDFYENNIAVSSHPFEGCIDVLDALKGHGARLAVCTNKTQALSERLLNTLELTDYFETIVGADSASNRKPSSDHVFETVTAAGGQLKRSVFVGDSRTDEKAALSAGLPFIFVSFGYEVAPPEDIQANARIAHYTEFLPALKNIID